MTNIYSVVYSVVLILLNIFTKMLLIFKKVYIFYFTFAQTKISLFLDMNKITIVYLLENQIEMKTTTIYYYFLEIWWAPKVNMPIFSS